MWRSLVARFVRDEEAAGSNPVIPTKTLAIICEGFSLYVQYIQSKIRKQINNCSFPNFNKLAYLAPYIIFDISGHIKKTVIINIYYNRRFILSKNSMNSKIKIYFLFPGT
jgi:hypothetical protein